MKRPDTVKLVAGGLAALGAVVALAGLLVVVQPQRAKAHSLDAQIGKAQLELASLHGGGTKSPTIRAAELFQLSRAMPDHIDMPGILLDLARLAEASSVTLVAVRPSTPAALADGSMAVPLSVTVNGSWAGVSRFLRNVRLQVQEKGARLAVAGRLFDIDSIQLDPGQKGDGLEAVLSLSAFVYGKPVAPAPAPTTTGSTTTTTSTTTTPSSGAQQAAGSAGAGS